MARIDRIKLRTLKRLRKKCHWNDENQRLVLLRELINLFSEWSDRLPNLLEFFRADEIDCLISQAILENWTKGCYGKYVLQKFVDFIVESGYEDQHAVDQDSEPIAMLRTTPVHLAYRHQCFFLVDQLLKIYNRCEVNYTDESGIGHFQIASKFGCHSMVEKFLRLGHDPNNGIVLHLALDSGHTQVAELLLLGGADPNLAIEADGSTPLHVMCAREHDEFESMEAFFAVNDLIGRQVQVDARNNFGCTPLLLAYERGHQQVSRALLRRGADPNSANDDGVTPLHVVCGKTRGAARTLIEIGEFRPLQLDARDKWGDTPLHHAIRYRNTDTDTAKLSRDAERWYVDPAVVWTSHDTELALRMEDDTLVEFLLRIGADPNSANNDGITPAHLACQRGKCELLELFLKANKDIGNEVRLDARDINGLTPLQRAVINFELRAIDLLANHGTAADLSGFVFPAFEAFDECLRPLVLDDRLKLNVTSGLVACVERLEERGYELVRDDALTIMRLFAKYKLLKEEDGPSWCPDEYFFKRMQITPNLSLYDLVQLPAKQAGKLIKHADCVDFARSFRLERLPVKFRAKCCVTLREIISRKFFLDWALDYLVELLHHRLPVLCCEMIADALKNEDLMNICFAAEQSRTR